MAGNTWGESWGIAGAFAWGDSWGFEGFVAPSTTPTIPPGGGRGLDYLSWWEQEWARIRKERTEKRRTKKVPKKKRELLEELDDIILELRSRVREDEAPKEVAAEVLAIDRFADLAIMSSEITAAQVRLQIRLAEAIMREMDDEEAIILALH